MDPLFIKLKTEMELKLYFLYDKQEEKVDKTLKAFWQVHTEILRH